MTAAAQRQAGGRTPLGQNTAPKKPVGRPKGDPSTMVNVRLPLALLARLDRSLDRLEVQTGRKVNRGMIARRTLERFLETHESSDRRGGAPRWGRLSPVSGMRAHHSRGEVPMYTSILLSVALQDWERYSAHALAAREAAATLAKGAATPLHVLSVYEYERTAVPVGLAAEMAARYRSDRQQRTDDLMERQMRDFISPLKDTGIEVNTLLRVGNPREVIVEAARSVMADLLIIGSHSKRGIIDISLGGTARHITQAAPCTVLMVSPKV